MRLKSGNRLGPKQGLPAVLLHQMLDYLSPAFQKTGFGPGSMGIVAIVFFQIAASTFIGLLGHNGADAYFQFTRRR